MSVLRERGSGRVKQGVPKLGRNVNTNDQNVNSQPCTYEMERRIESTHRVLRTEDDHRRYASAWLAGGQALGMAVGRKSEPIHNYGRFHTRVKLTANAALTTVT